MTRGCFVLQGLYGSAALDDALERLKPAEILISEQCSLHLAHQQVRQRPPWEFDKEAAFRLLCSQFNTQNLEGFGCTKDYLALGAAGCLLQYVKYTQKIHLHHIHTLRVEKSSEYVYLDAATRRHLELTESYTGRHQNTLAAIYDCTVTPMGSRKMGRWLHQPSRHRQILLRRQQIIQSLLLQKHYANVQDILSGMGDVERVLARVGLLRARPRDLLHLRYALSCLPHLRDLLQMLPEALADHFYRALIDFNALESLLHDAIVDEPPSMVREGGVIATGYDESLDALLQLSSDSNQVLIDLEKREQARTGIASLKIVYHRVQDYCITVSRAQADRVPEHYVRRQMLKHIERYTIPELQEHESRVLSAQSRALAREKWLYEALQQKITEQLAPLQSMSDALAELDVLTNLAERADSLHLVCPTLSESIGIDIRQGRHPVIAQMQSDQAFVPNDAHLDQKRRMLMITGPNMGGKSTYMRQTALITILAYIGSFVPAEQATIGQIDRIFTRIGASDDLTSGRSTFMVEMTETANILNNATQMSLVLMDEVGRGTSTFDGLSLAWASALHLVNDIQALTLFATHYFELTHLARQHPRMVNVHFDAHEQNGRLAFLYQLKVGATDRSYGLQVARLAGCPKK